MSTFGEIKIVDRPARPPIFLGDSSINVAVGQIANITRSILMNTNPAYQHPLSNPVPGIGGISIVGFFGNSNNFLSQTNNANTFGVLSNGSSRIYYNNGFYNNDVYKATLDANNFKIQGVRVGSGVITYKASAFDTLTQLESDMSNAIGSIQINVFSLTNRPPVLTNGGLLLCEFNNYALFTSSFFLTSYTDPEGDAPSMLRINSLPTVGSIIYNGIVVTSAMLPFIIPISDVDDGMLYYHASNMATVGAVYPFDYNVSDVGSQQFSN